MGKELQMRRQPFEQVVAEYGPTVLRVCRAAVAGDAAEDAWSETFLAAMRAYPELDETANVEAWLVTIARRKSIDQHRAATRRAVPVEAVLDRAATVVPSRLDHEELWNALRALPPVQREAVAYHHLVGLPYSQVGELLGNSEAAARRAAADGMKRLRSTYEVTKS